MEAKKLKRTKKSGPEAIIQSAIEKMLKGKDWFVLSTHGNLFQFGLPDLYCAHSKYGARWIEIKCPTQYSFTGGQLEVFPALQSKGVGIWIMTCASEHQYQWLFGKPNWHCYLGRSSCPWDGK